MDISTHKVLVTGADGFIGSHLVEALMEEGRAVRAFVYYNSFNSCGWLDAIPDERLKNVEIITGDIRDPHRVEEAMRGCDMVFHLAALIAIPYSYHSPDSYIDTNVKGTLNVLQAARKLGTAKILHTSTSEVYGTARYTPIDEGHALQGQSPYSATKIAADKIAESFYRSFNVPVATVRPFNTYGPRQSARAVIPTIIIQLLSGASVIKLGMLDAVRDFNYVKDTARAFVEIAKSDRAIGEEINVATGVGVSIGDVAEMIMRATGKRADIVLDTDRIRPQKSEVEKLIGDNTKICSYTNWKPCYDLEKGIAETVQWFSIPENLRRYKALLYNI